MPHHALERRGQGRGVAGRHEQTGDLGLDQLGDAGKRRAHRGELLALRFQEHVRQAVAIAMGFLQLLVAELAFGRRPTAVVAAGLTAAGAVIYSAGYGLGLVWPAGGWLAPRLKAEPI